LTRRATRFQTIGPFNHIFSFSFASIYAAWRLQFANVMTMYVRIAWWMATSKHPSACLCVCLSIWPSA